MRALCMWTAVGLFSLAPNVAMADIISDEEAQCRSQSEGDACKAGGEAGTCQKSTCSRNDYSEGAPPKIKEVECMVCKPGAPAPDPVAAEEDAPEATASKDAKADSKDEASSKSGGCRVGSPAPVGLGVVLLGGVFWMRRRS